MPDHNGTDRLDRIERAIELLIEDHMQFRDQHKSLLKSQVLLTDSLGSLVLRVDTLALRVDTIAKHLGTLTVKVEEVTDKLNGLIGYVEGQHKPPQ
jgi:hypothetical protein